MALRILVLSLLIHACGNSPAAPLEGPVPENRARSVASNRLCDEWRRCDCGEAAGGVSLAGCETGIGFTWDGAFEEAAALGLTYDGDCLSRRLNAMLERGCSTEPTSFDCGPETCQVFHGSVAEGAECDGSVSASNCAQGLICLGTCQLPCSLPSGLPLTEGERCREGDEVTGFCDTGLVCDLVTELCAALPGPGAACVMSACAEGNYCDFTADPPLCMAAQPPGTMCVSPMECTSFQCEMGTCAEPPTEGEACLRVCAADLVCAPDAAGASTCQRVPTAGEACLSELTLERCAEGLACVEGTCIEPPGRGEPCIDPSAGSRVSCAGDLICGALSCRITPSAPGCDECTEPEGDCIVRVCQPVPAAVCGDNGGVLIVL